MFAYHGDPLIKKELVLRLKDDFKFDRIVHGHYWENGKGCAVGCTIRGSDHAAYESELGIPQSIARLEDSIFEGLANGAAQKFPLDFAAAIRPGADLSKVTAQFLVWVLLDRKHGAIRQAPKEKYADCHNSILAAAAVWTDYLKTGVINKEAAYSAADSARSAADSARSATDSAAYSAADSARSAAYSAAYSARSAADSAAYSAFWKAAAVTLLKLLKKAPIR